MSKLLSATLAMLVSVAVTPVFADDAPEKVGTKSEMQALKQKGPSVSGESSDFDSYLNDDVYLKDDPWTLVEFDKDARVDLEKDEAVGVALNVGFEDDPVKPVVDTTGKVVGSAANAVTGNNQ